MSPGRPPDEIEPVEAYDPDLDPAVLRRRRELALTFLAVAAIVAGCLVLAFYMLRSPPVTRPQVIAAAEDAVREAGAFSRPLQFGEPLSIDSDDDQDYVVRGEALGFSPEGAPIHFWFACLLRRTQEGKLVRSQLTISVH